MAWVFRALYRRVALVQHRCDTSVNTANSWISCFLLHQTRSLPERVFGRDLTANFNIIETEKIITIKTISPKQLIPVLLLRSWCQTRRFWLETPEKNDIFHYIQQNMNIYYDSHSFCFTFTSFCDEEPLPIPFNSKPPPISLFFASILNNKILTTTNNFGLCVKILRLFVCLDESSYENTQHARRNLSQFALSLLLCLEI